VEWEAKSGIILPKAEELESMLTPAQRQLSFGSGCRSHCGNCHQCTEDITAKTNNANFTQSAYMPINSETTPRGQMTRSTTGTNAPPDKQTTVRLQLQQPLADSREINEELARDLNWWASWATQRRTL